MSLKRATSRALLSDTTVSEGALSAASILHGLWLLNPAWERTTRSPAYGNMVVLLKPLSTVFSLSGELVLAVAFLVLGFAMLMTAVYGGPKTRAMVAKIVFLVWMFVATVLVIVDVSSLLAAIMVAVTFHSLMVAVVLGSQSEGIR